MCARAPMAGIDLCSASRPFAASSRRVVLAGPAHRVYVTGAAIPSAHAFASPLGPVPLDLEALDVLRALDFVEVSDRAHALEHSLEVHLPFLQSVLGDFSLVPVVVGDALRHATWRGSSRRCGAAPRRSSW